LAWVRFSDKSSQQILYWASFNPDWTTQLIRLTLGKFVSGLEIGLDNLAKEDNTSGAQSFLVDFIMLAQK